MYKHVEIGWSGSKSIAINKILNLGHFLEFSIVSLVNIVSYILSLILH